MLAILKGILSKWVKGTGPGRLGRHKDYHSNVPSKRIQTSPHHDWWRRQSGAESFIGLIIFVGAFESCSLLVVRALSLVVKEPLRTVARARPAA